MVSFVKMNRTPMILDIIVKHRPTWILLCIIASRICREGNQVLGLLPGEAFIGDFEKFGMTEREYRTSKDNLKKWQLCDFKTTSKGTTAFGLTNAVFDTNTTDETTDERRASDGQATTNKKEQERNKKEQENNNDSKESNIDFDLIFQEFYSLYPKKVNKAASSTKLKTKIKQDGYPAIKKGLEQYLIYWRIKETKKEYIPAPDVWLNKEKYNDDLDSEIEPTPDEIEDCVLANMQEIDRMIKYDIACKYVPELNRLYSMEKGTRTPEEGLMIGRLMKEFEKKHGILAAYNKRMGFHSFSD